MAEKVFPLKKSALQVDIEIDKDKGVNDDDKKDLLEETTADMENTKDPEKPLNVSCIICILGKGHHL